MNKEKAIKLLSSFNKWRRCNDGTNKQPSPSDVGDAIDFAVNYMEMEMPPSNPSAFKITDVMKSSDNKGTVVFIEYTSDHIDQCASVKVRFPSIDNGQDNHLMFEDEEPTNEFMLFVSENNPKIREHAFEVLTGTLDRIKMQYVKY